MLRFVPEDTQNFAVMDLEWNQRASRPNHAIPHEIIEIGAVLLDRELHLLDRKQLVIRPVLYPVLDRHIREVTGIEQAELEKGMTFPEAFECFTRWCGPHTCLCTWGRDDYPVLLRNARYYRMELPFDPPLNLQTLYAYLMTDKPQSQVGLSAAMEQMGMEMDLPAHRALNDATYTARLLCALQDKLRDAPEEVVEALRRAGKEEALAARSDARSVQTAYTRYDEILGDPHMTAVRCPICGGVTEATLPWFDSGHGRFLELCRCPEHGDVFAQMHFKRQYNNRLLVHQRAYPATPERVADVEARKAASHAMRKTERAGGEAE